MRSTRTRADALAALFVSCLAGAAGPASAADPQGQSWSLYAGKYTADPLPDHILLIQPITFENAWISVVTYGRTLARPSASRRWEGEVQFGVHHSGVQDHVEADVALLHRWSDWPWDGLIKTSFALGGGLSYASEVPYLEATGKPGADATRLLFYMALEFEAVPAGTERFSVFGRIHHRSGVFGTFNGVHGGSDHVGIGVRWYLPR